MSDTMHNSKYVIEKMIVGVFTAALFIMLILTAQSYKPSFNKLTLFAPWVILLSGIIFFIIRANYISRKANSGNMHSHQPWQQSDEVALFKSVSNPVEADNVPDVKW